ncbi:hypothetical protein WG66_002433 [Moniliophthora roreri]|nr:hypothetical protein WG66_002433 [Moniliophthora roreri]
MARWVPRGCDSDVTVSKSRKITSSCSSTWTVAMYDQALEFVEEIMKVQLYTEFERVFIGKVFQALLIKLVEHNGFGAWDITLNRYVDFAVKSCTCIEALSEYIIHWFTAVIQFIGRRKNEIIKWYIEIVKYSKVFLLKVLQIFEFHYYDSM